MLQRDRCKLCQLENQQKLNLQNHIFFQKNLIYLSILCLNNWFLEHHEIHNSQGNSSIATDVATQNRIVGTILTTTSFPCQAYGCTQEQSTEDMHASKFQGSSFRLRAPESSMLLSYSQIQCSNSCITTHARSP